MKNELQVIDQREILDQDFKMYGTVEQPLFLAKDVAEWIDYAIKDKETNRRNVNMMLEMVEDNEKLRATLFTSGQNREMWFLTEDGLYEVLMLSRKPIAKEFKKEVKHILKTLRTTGGYINDANKFVDTYYKNVSPELREACRQQFAVIEELNKKIEQDAPKVLFANAVDTATNCISFNELAKVLKQNGIETGQNRLMEQLRNEGYLMSVGANKNMPTQRAMELGLFEVKENLVEAPVSSFTTFTTKVTPKGQKYFINKFVGVAL